MAQKIPSHSLRLGINRYHDTFWFSDRMYETLVHNTLQAKQFIHNIFQLVGDKTAISHLHATSHVLFIDSFMCNPRKLNKRLQKKKCAYLVTDSFAPLHARYTTFDSKETRNALYSVCLSNNGTFFDSNTCMKKNHIFMLLAHAKASQQKKYVASSACLNRHSECIQTKLRTCGSESSTFYMLQRSKSDPNHSMEKLQTKKCTNYKSHIESVLTRYFNKHVIWTPHKMKSLFTCAAFIANYIALQLEQNKRKPFRYITRDVFHQCDKLPSIEGIRISCAGRMNGAEMASLQTVSKGHTSLHVFDHRIDYHATAAYTPYGLVGIKVWLSFA
jgi:hypothetical protein